MKHESMPAPGQECRKSGGETGMTETGMNMHDGAGHCLTSSMTNRSKLQHRLSSGTRHVDASQIHPFGEGFIH